MSDSGAGEQQARARFSMAMLAYAALVGAFGVVVVLTVGTPSIWAMIASSATALATIVVGLLGFTGVIASLVWNAKLAREAHAREVERRAKDVSEDRRRQAAAILAEVGLLRSAMVGWVSAAKEEPHMAAFYLANLAKRAEQHERRFETLVAPNLQCLPVSLAIELTQTFQAFAWRRSQIPAIFENTRHEPLRMTEIIGDWFLLSELIGAVASAIGDYVTTGEEPESPVIDHAEIAKQRDAKVDEFAEAIRAFLKKRGKL